MPPGVTLEVRARALRRLRAAISDTCALTQGLDTAAPVLVISDGSGEAASARQEYRGTFETALGTHLVFEQPVSAAAAGAETDPAAAGAEADPVADTSGAHEVTAGANDKASVVPEKAGERPRSLTPHQDGPTYLLCLITATAVRARGSPARQIKQYIGTAPTTRSPRSRAACAASRWGGCETSNPASNAVCVERELILSDRSLSVEMLFVTPARYATYARVVQQRERSENAPGVTATARARAPSMYRCARARTRARTRRCRPPEAAAREMARAT